MDFGIEELAMRWLVLRRRNKCRSGEWKLATPIAAVSFNSENGDFSHRSGSPLHTIAFYQRPIVYRRDYLAVVGL